MKRQKTKKVNGLLIFSICLLILAIATPITLSFFTAQKSGTKEITFGKIELKEGVTQVLTNVNVIPGDSMFEDDILVAKDIFSEDMIVRAKFEFEDTTGSVATYTGITNSGIDYSVTVADMLNGAKILETTHDGLYIIDYTVGNEDKVGYSNNGGYAGSNGSNVFSVLADIANPSGYISGVTGTARTVKFESVTTAVDANGNYLDQIFDGTGYVLSYTGRNQEDGYAKNYRWVLNNEDGYYYLAEFDTTTLTATEVTPDANPENPVDGNIYEVTVNGKSVRVLYNAGTYYSGYTGTLANGLNSKFRNIKKADELIYDAANRTTVKYDLYNGIGNDSGTETADLTDAQARQTLVDTFYGDDDPQTNDTKLIAKVEVTDDGDGTYSYTNGSTYDIASGDVYVINNNTPTIFIAGEIQSDGTITYTYGDNVFTVSNEDTDVELFSYSEIVTKLKNGGLGNKEIKFYQHALQAANHILAEKLAKVQELFVLLNKDNRIPLHLSSLTNNAQFGTGFTVSVQFNAIQSKYLSTTVSSTTYYVAGNNPNSISDLLTAFGGGDKLFDIPAPAQP